MRRQIWTLVCCITAVAVLASFSPGLVYGASGTWNKGTGNWVWQDAANWSGATPPGVGETAQFGRIDWARPVAIDMKGSSYNFQKIQGNYNGSVEVFYDSDFLTPNANPLGTNSSVATLENFSHGYGSLVEAANASPTLSADDITFNKQHVPVFYLPLVIADELWPTENASMYFYGDVTAGRITETRNDGWGTRVNFKSDLTVGSLFNPRRGGTSGQILTVDGLATVGTLIGEGQTVNFNDFHATTEVRQANESIVNISGRYSGTATYIRDPNASGETRTPSLNLLSGSTLAPGASIGTLGGTALDVNIAGDSNYEWEVGAPPASSTPGVGWDLSLANIFDIDGPFNIEIVEMNLTGDISPGDEFPILGANGFDLAGLNLRSDVNFSVVADLATWDITGARLDLVQGFADLDGIPGSEDALVLSGLSARLTGQAGDIPEPATLALLSVAVAGLGGYIRKRRTA